MNDELLRPSNDPDRWRECAEAMNDALLRIDMDAARRKPVGGLSERDADAERMKAMDEMKKALSLMQYNQWPLNRILYTLGQLDTERLMLCCERKIADWQQSFNAKAAFGAPRDLVRMADGMRQAGVNLELVNPLRYAAKPMLLVAGLRHEGNIDTTDQLLKMGADPATDNGQIFQTAVLEGRADIARVIAKHGQNGVFDLVPWLNWAKSNRKLKAYEDIRQIHWEYGRFTALDAETLAETKTLPDNTGTLRVIYNFASRRVEEIHEFTNPRQNVVNGFTFDEYGEPALDAARDKLIELGGRPSDLAPSLRGKSSVSRPSSYGIGKT